LGAPQGAPQRLAAVVEAPAEEAAGEHGGDLAEPDVAPREPFPVALDLVFATHVPISIGVEANLELPLGLLVRAHLGGMPEAYVDIINGVATGFGAYPPELGRLATRSIGGAFVFRASAGIRPFAGYGFEILAGYTLIEANGGVTSREFEQATGQSMSWPGMERIGVHATIHAFHAEIGWSALVWDHLVLRASLGWVHTLDAQGSLVVPQELRAMAAGRIEGYEETARTALERWGFGPEVRLGAGYRF
jgi:hypothetical protein